MNVSTLLLALPLAAALLTGCKKDSDLATGSLSLHLDAQANGSPFVLGTPVTKSDGQTFAATEFKYYVSNLRLLQANGSSYDVPESYYLVDAARPATAQLRLKDIPLGEYTGISFLAGVDAARNTAGAQTGALDPNNGMFWDWNQGYIFTRLEGTSVASPTGGLVFHIGGVSAIRPVLLSFGSRTLEVGEQHAASIHLLVNPLALFESDTPARRISFATTYNVMGSHPATGTIADNIAAGMFMLSHIQNN